MGHPDPFCLEPCFFAKGSDSPRLTSRLATSESTGPGARQAAVAFLILANDYLASWPHMAAASASV